MSAASKYPYRYTRDGQESDRVTDGGEAVPRPLRAVRLMDELNGERQKTAPPAGREDVPCKARGSRSLAAAEPYPAKPAPKGASLRDVTPRDVTPRDVAPRVRAPRDMASRDVARRDMPPRDMPPSDASPRPASPRRQTGSASPRPSQAPAEDPSIPHTLAADSYAVLSVRPDADGASVTVVMAVPAFAPAAGRSHEKLSLHLMVEQYADLNVRAGELTPEAADAILSAGKLCDAVRRGMAILQYGDQSERRLAFKLTAKGVDREIAALAAAYLSEKGYIREDDTARLRAEESLRKLRGPRRIREDLRALGFSSEAVDEAMEALSDVDFCENCAKLIRKKYRSVPNDRTERQKLIAAMMRQGYDADTVRHALQLV